MQMGVNGFKIKLFLISDTYLLNVQILRRFYCKINLTFSLREMNELIQTGSISACFVKVKCSSKH